MSNVEGIWDTEAQLVCSNLGYYFCELNYCMPHIHRSRMYRIIDVLCVKTDI